MNWQAISSTVRVRIAPSPTGNLHVGTARTALFNYLFAKRHNGTFILRIEDTDTERSNAAYAQNIFDSLRAMGMQWDEGPDVGGPYAPYTQMERLPDYQRAIQALIDHGYAYAAYETPEELDAQREAAKAANVAYKYMPPSEAVRAQQATDPTRVASIRFRIPPERQTVTVHDAVRGSVPFDAQLIGDFVIQKSNGVPTYNFAVVVDDVAMKITHVVRGEDHLSNTPKQILIYEALAACGLAPKALPQFAHVGMILAPDRSKLSKRHGATAVSDFIAQGYLPEAFCNFITLLGWAPSEGQEFAPLAEHAAQFSLERIAHSPAIFETDKLHWLNKQYLKALDDKAFLALGQPYLDQAGLSLEAYTPEQQAAIMHLVREPLTLISELPEAVRYFVDPLPPYAQDIVDTLLSQPDAPPILSAFQAQLLPLLQANATVDELKAGIKALTESLQPLKTKTVMWTVRAALTGRTGGADMAPMLQLLGAVRCQARIALAQALA